MKKGIDFPVIIGTRGSELALWQANFTKSVLEKSGFWVELKIIKTKGDTTQQWNLSFDKMEGKGFFTKELEDALLANEIDLAVHSCKDLPTEFPKGLTIAAYSKRANPFDILLIRKESVDETKQLKLKENAVVGTSSARRKAQLMAFRPDIQLQDLRGNVPTRVKKLTEENYDAIVLASAGLERLNIDLSAFEKVALKAPMFIPAPAQGVLAFQIREEDAELKNICELLNDESSSEIAAIERQLLHDFEGGCQMPLGVFAEKSGNKIDIWISQASAWNTFPKRLHVEINEPAADFNSAAIVKQLRNATLTSVFISSALDENEYIIRALKAHNYSVNYETFIEFKQVDFNLPQAVNWLFFSSKNGVKYFFNTTIQQFSNSSIKLAAINQGTAQAIYELGLPVDFIGQGSDLQKIATDFDEVATGKIFFPQAKKSMQSIQKNLINNTDIESLVVYENQPLQNIEKQEAEILIFTSPMSVEAYFSKFKLDENQRVISIGKTTSKKLQDFSVNNVKTAFEPSYWSILDEVF
jgi:hydroxymethylbilane synthase